MMICRRHPQRRGIEHWHRGLHGQSACLQMDSLCRPCLEARMDAGLKPLLADGTVITRDSLADLLQGAAATPTSRSKSMAQKKTCIFDRCSKPVKARGLCVQHYSKAHRAGTLDDLGLAPDPKKAAAARRGKLRESCAVRGCGRDHKARARCSLHYGRAHRHGWLDEDPATDEDRWTQRRSSQDEPATSVPDNEGASPSAAADLPNGTTDVDRLATACGDARLMEQLRRQSEEAAIRLAVLEAAHHLPSAPPETLPEIAHHAWTCVRDHLLAVARGDASLAPTEEH